MVRRCIVPQCTSTDQTTLVHRFPRKHCKTWQKCLSLNAYRLNDLLDKYVVCAHHFHKSDYRNAESKHLNTTALPTLDIIPENEKHPGIHTEGTKVQKQNIGPDSEVINQIPNSNSMAGKTKIYSNCFTLSTSSPQMLSSHHGLTESDDSNENHLNSDYDMLDEDNYLDEEILVQPIESEDISNTKDLPDCEDIVEYLERETVTDNGRSNCDRESNYCTNLATEILNDCLTKYVELIETNDDSDEEYKGEQQVVREISSSNYLYENLSKNDLIQELTVATNRIKELETKLANIQEAHLNMIQNFNNFNKVLIN